MEPSEFATKYVNIILAKMIDSYSKPEEYLTIVETLIDKFQNVYKQLR